jgi:hypothetical protein
LNDARVIDDIDSATGLSRGRFAISPAGHLVTLPIHAPLKTGWRWATAGDLKPKVSAPAAGSLRPADDVAIEVSVEE